MATALLNERKLNFDGKLQFAKLQEATKNLSTFDDTMPDQVAERSQDCEVLITKEMPVSAATIEQLPSTVRLICEAGTGTACMSTREVAGRMCL